MRLRVKIAAGLLCPGIFACASVALSAESIDLERGAGVYAPGLHASAFVDRRGDFSYELRDDPRFRKAFRPVGKSIPNFGFQDADIWLRFQVRNPFSERQRMLLEIMPNLEAVEVFSSASDRRLRAGRGVSSSEFARIHRNHVFPLDFPTHSEHTIYLRVRSRSPIFTELKLWTPEAHRARDYDEHLFFGAFFGIIAVVVLYNVFFFAAVRERAYLYYVLHGLAIGLVFASAHGFARQYLWPESPVWNVRSIPILADAALLFGLLFTQSFLNLPRSMPRLNAILSATIACTTVIVALGFLGEWSALWLALLTLNCVAFPLILIAGVTSLLRGNRAARFFVAGWSVWIFALVLENLMAGGVLAFDTFTLSYLQLPAASAVEMLLLSMALADRYRILRVDRERLRSRALRNRLYFHRAATRSRRLERELLKKTIQPHFLMNSLSAAQGWLRRNPRRADRLIQALARELRLILDNSRSRSVPLATEIDVCRAHLRVMGYRMIQRFRMRVRGITGDEAVPPLIFHTLLENAFTHLNGPDVRLEFLLEKSRAEPGGSLYRFISIAGSPAGRPQPHALPALSAEGLQRREGTGMRYIRARLEEMCPGRWRLNYGARPDGFQVEIWIPDASEARGLGQKARGDSR